MELLNKEYNRLIKQRLSDWKAAFEKANGVRLNYSAIVQMMSDQFNITTSAQKISAMFDTLSDREVKLPELVALAQLFDIPLWDICQYPNSASIKTDLYKLTTRKKIHQAAIREVDNRFYEGDYYCYYFKPKHHEYHMKPLTDYEIEEAQLTIRMDAGHTVITLEELKHSTTFYGEPMPAFTLTGKLYYFDHSNIAYSFISDDKGRRAMALMFGYLKLSADIRYYMTVGMLTFSLNQTHAPLFQKMAVFRERQPYTDKESGDILRGILSLNTSSIIVDAETISGLAEEDHDLQTALTALLEEKKSFACYAFSENTILNNLSFITDDDKRIKKILKIKSNSLLHANEIISEIDGFADFVKSYQQSQMKTEKDLTGRVSETSE